MRAFLGQNAFGTLGTSQTIYFSLASGIGGVTPNQNTESARQTKWRAAGVFRDLSVHVSSHGAGSGDTVTLRVAGADTALTVSIPSGQTGFFNDTTHSATVAAGDAVVLKWVRGNATLTALKFSTTFNATSNNSVVAGYVRNTISTSATGFFGIFGLSSATELALQFTARQALTMKNMYVNIFSNTRDGTTTFKSRKNGADGNLVISVTAGSTGQFEDTTHTDSVAAGDLICTTCITAGTTGSIVIQNVQIELQTTVFENYLGGGSASSLSSGVSYGPFNGGITSATESSTQQKLLSYMGRLKKLGLRLTTNTVNGTSTFISRIAGADGTLTLSIPSATSGYFEDLTHEDVVTASQFFNWKMTVGGSTGTMVMAVIVVLLRAQPDDVSFTGSDTMSFSESDSETVYDLTINEQDTISFTDSLILRASDDPLTINIGGEDVTNKVLRR